MDDVEDPRTENVSGGNTGLLTDSFSAVLTVGGAAIYLVSAPAVGVAILWPSVGLGALGWLIALMLRAPVAVGARRITETALDLQRIVVWASGPAEEITRLVIVLIAVQDLPTAVAIGLGWSLIEGVYAVPQPMIRAHLRRRTDPQAQEAREVLAALGLDRDVGPLWPGIERLFASGFHIGVTLLVAWQPWFVIGAVPLHSALNVSVLALLRRDIKLAMGLVGLVGAAVLAAGLAVWL